VFTYSNGNVKTIESLRSNFSKLPGVITNWTIDSDEAMEIAKKNQTISEYLSKCPDTSIFMELWSNETYSCVWWIEFWCPFDGDNPYHAMMCIDGHTGQVLSARAVQVGSVYSRWWPYVAFCILLIAIPIIIAEVIVLVIRKVLLRK
jgi:hypothetical protein